MEILRIDVSNKKEDFDELYNIAEKEYNFLVYSGNFVLLTENKDIRKLLQNVKDITINEIKDINRDVDKEFVRSWIKEELAKKHINNINNEIQGRISVMYDILSETEKLLKEKEELDKQNELQKGKRKNSKK